MARPEIEKAEQLRGKSLGITRFGTSIDTGARIALRHFGLVPEKDVAIVQIGGMESIVPAMHANRVQAGILSYPSITQAKKLGHHTLLDIAASAFLMRPPDQHPGPIDRDDPDLVRRHMASR
jgi:ABC-type nitrate/sulfonate/bicarbonate transport system substrate-binding protein